MFLIGGRGQPVRTPDGVVHLITQYDRGGFSDRTPCGVLWRRAGAMFVEASEDEAVSCMTCLVHEARS